MKIDMNLKCPYCEKEMWHNSVCLDDDGNANTFCWEDEGGCGKELFVTTDAHVDNYQVHKM